MIQPGKKDKEIKKKAHEGIEWADDGRTRWEREEMSGHYTAPRICTLLNIPSHASARTVTTCLHSHIFSSSLLSGFENAEMLCLTRNSRVSVGVSNASSVKINRSGSLWYLLYSGRSAYRKTKRSEDVRSRHNKQGSDTLALNEVVHNVCTHVWCVDVKLK